MAEQTTQPMDLPPGQDIYGEPVIPTEEAPKIDISSIPQGPGSNFDSDTVDGIQAVTATKAGPNKLVATDSTGKLPSAILPSVTSSQIIAYVGNGYGSTNTKIRRFTNTVVTGTDITYTNSATLGGYFTINTAGTYSISYCDAYSGGATAIGISLNTSVPTTSMDPAFTYAQGGRGQVTTASATFFACVASTLPLAVNDVIRAHTDGGANSTADSCMFIITKI